MPGNPASQSTTNDGSAIPGRKFAVEENKKKRSKVNYSRDHLLIKQNMGNYIYRMINSISNLLEETTLTLNNILGTDIKLEDINNIYPIGELGLQENPIVLKFVFSLKKQDLYKNIQSLNGTGIAISNDTSYEERQNIKF
ncbi:hypothetical protein JTB14_037334 [Gonioctena quinquepunctata]|nr:hypothetical protein JTB14_037334 [Gonioctena quinquepunctata]